MAAVVLRKLATSSPCVARVLWPASALCPVLPMLVSCVRRGPRCSHPRRGWIGSDRICSSRRSAALSHVAEPTGMRHCFHLMLRRDCCQRERHCDDTHRYASALADAWLLRSHCLCFCSRVHDSATRSKLLNCTQLTHSERQHVPNYDTRCAIGLCLGCTLDCISCFCPSRFWISRLFDLPIAFNSSRIPHSRFAACKQLI